MKSKPLACILALAMCIMNFTPLPVTTVYAADPSVDVSISSVEGTPGDEVQVDVTLSNNPGLTCMLVMVGYDSDVLECTNVTENGLFGAGNFVKPPLTNNPLRLNWGDGLQDWSENGVLATLTFKIKDTAYNGETALTLSTEAGNTFNYDFVDYDINFTNGKVTVSGSTNKKEYEGELPSAPAVTDVTASGFSVTVSSGCEFTYSDAAVTDFSACVWSEDSVVSGLKANTKYYVYQRVKETDIYKASSASAAAEVTTSKKSLADIIESVSIGTDGTAGTVLKPVITYKTGSSAADAGELSYVWSNGSTAETYTIAAADVIAGNSISVAVSASNAAGSVDSNAVTAGKADYTGTVKAPVIGSVAADGFTIDGEDGYEYYVSETDSAPSADAEWTTELKVTGLVPEKTYYVFGRVQATDTVNASVASKSTSVTIPSNNTALKSLTVSNGTMLPAFDKAVYEYSVVVPYGDEIPAVSAEAADSKATVSITNASDFETSNKATVTVTAENKSDSKVYTVTFTQQERTAAPEIVTDNTNAISRADGVIEIKGNGTVYYTTDGSEPTVSSEKYTSAISVSSLNIPLTTSSFTVKAAALEDGKVLSEVAEKTFKLTDTDATLSALTVNGTALTGFSSSVLNYTYDVSYSDWVSNKAKTYTVAAVTSKTTSSAEISENGFTLASGNSDAVSSKEIIITVTSENGDKTSYVITFNVLACEHSEKTVVIASEATCTAAGKKEIRCNLCDMYISEEEIPAKGHVTDNGVITTEPTCTEDGVKTFTCTACSATDTEAVPALGHDIDDGKVTTEPTCTADGVKTFSCSRCDVTETEAVPALGHDIDDGKVTAEPTCTADGVKTFSCSRCDVTETEAVPALGHELDEGTITTEPTCEEDGVKTFACSRCDVTETEAVPALGHELDNGVVTKEPTCTEEGVRTYNCTRCNLAETESIPVLGHDLGEGQVTTEPTCTENGVKTFKCSRCTVEETESVPALGHDHAAEVSVISEATCTEDGVTGRKCSRCDNVTDKTLVQAAGHQWSSWTQLDALTYERSCSICSATESSSVTDTSHDHSFNGTVEVITAATCTAEGSQKVYCTETGCTEYITESIAKTAHTASVVSEVPASCTTSGSNVTVCSVCAVELLNVDIPALGHDYSNGKAADAYGHWDQCARCSERTHTESHVPGGGVAEGNIIKYPCSICGYVIRTEQNTGNEEGDSENNTGNGGSTAPIPGYVSGSVSAPVAPSTPVPSTNFVSGPVEPQIDGDASLIGWKKILKKINTTEENTVVVDMNTYTEVPAEIIDAIKGKDIDLVLKFSYYTWTINGNDVREAKDINLSVSKNRARIPEKLIEEISGDNDYIQITLAHSGDLGFDAKLTLSVGNKYNGLNANMFYYRKSAQSLEFTDTSVVSGGTAEFLFDHASSYAVILSSDTLGYEDVGSEAGIFDNSNSIAFNSNNVSAGATVGIIVILSAAVVVYLKKKEY